eukprot:12872372-Ditylum_brightwellii.AAC.1
MSTKECDNDARNGNEAKMVAMVTPTQICCLGDNVHQGTQMGESDECDDGNEAKMVTTVTPTQICCLGDDVYQGTQIGE